MNAQSTILPSGLAVRAIDHNVMAVPRVGFQVFKAARPHAPQAADVRVVDVAEMLEHDLRALLALIESSQDSTSNRTKLQGGGISGGWSRASRPNANVAGPRASP